ncbi:MAG: DUF4038 domain-containing protein [Acidimicrobiia bacterium]|nr:DUF4038 domain-containing protein [Acidimicrobiia bacterium]NNF08736.1 DUF4038 domain-containing protein [Acidimicrobiia bacterium]NNL70224.1 DUF4038 domain-containing protein [Acidimicrobiia bacterium]
MRRALWLVPAFVLPLLLLGAGSAYFTSGPPEQTGGVLLRSETTPPALTRPSPEAALPDLPEASTELDLLNSLAPGPAGDPLTTTDEAPDGETDTDDDSPATTTSTSTTAPTPGAATTTTSPPTPPTTNAPTTTTSPPATAPPPPPPTTTTTAPPPPPPPQTGGTLRLWDTAWQIAAKANDGAMQEYVDRLANASGTGGQNLTGFWFSVVNINQDINTGNGFGHTFGNFSNPNTDYLNDVERLIGKAAARGLKVGIVVAWDGPNQFSVESGKLNAGNAYQYGNTIASRWTRPDFSGRSAIDAWVMGGDTTDDCCGGEHGAIWAEVVRGIKDAQAANGFSGPQILFHTAPGQHLNYVGAPWLDAHAPQTGHCADANTASNWMQELAATGAPIWGNGEMRYEGITWACNGNNPISPEQVRDDVVAMKNLGVMGNFVYGFDPRWNASTPGSTGMSASGVSAGLQLILDTPGLIRPR